MLTTRPKLTIDSARRMLRHGAYRKVAHMLEAMRPGDAAAFFESIPVSERRRLAAILGRAALLNLLGAMSVDLAVETFADMDDTDLVALLGQVPREDAAAVVRFLPAERREAVLAMMDARTSGAVEALLAFPAGTVGAIMKPHAFSLEEGLTVGEAVEVLQGAANGGPVFYIYVTDKRGYLVGVVSYRMLLLSRKETRLAEIMRTDVSAVRVDEPQDEAAEVISRHDLVAVPVVDGDHRLLGVVTVDDIIDRMQAKAAENLYKMVGLGPDDRVFCPRGRSVRKRLPWLAVNLVTALLSASVVSLFQGSIEAAAILAVFMPIVAGLGGNAATQSLTVMIRGLTIGEVTSRDLPRAVLKEGSVTLMIGLALGTVMSVVAWIWDANPYLGLTLGLAMVANMMVAGVAGAVVPLALRAVGIDPAAASGVIITTFTDCCGFFSFLGLATLLIHHIAV